MAVYVNNISINIGADFSKDFYLDQPNGLPLNLVGYAASSYIRKHPESVNPTAKFNVSFIDNTNGRIRLSLGSSITSSIKPGRYVYDVLLTSPSFKKSIVVEGNILAREDATNSVGVDASVTAATADYFVVTYTFTDGSDLDTRTSVTSPVGITGTIGWGRDFTIGVPAFATWGGDNTGIGVESFLFNKAVFKESYPGISTITFDLRAFWYGYVGVNPVVINVTSYAGGSMVKTGFTWNNPTAKQTFVGFTSTSKVITSAGQSPSSNGQRIALMTLDFNEGVVGYST